MHQTSEMSDMRKLNVLWEGEGGGGVCSDQSRFIAEYDGYLNCSRTVSQKQVGSSQQARLTKRCKERLDGDGLDVRQFASAVLPRQGDLARASLVLGGSELLPASDAAQHAREACTWPVPQQPSW